MNTNRRNFLLTAGAALVAGPAAQLTKTENGNSGEFW
jgi:hypothetical protein